MGGGDPSLGGDRLVTGRKAKRMVDYQGDPFQIPFFLGGGGYVCT